MLDSVCQSDTWNDDQLDGLGLLGLQPCFEDVILQLPVFMALIAISVYRSRQCYLAGPLQPRGDWQSRASSYLKILCCFGNVIVNIVLISIIRDPAVFEQLVIPFGILAWLAMTAMTVINYSHFSYQGQWAPRFCFLWVFVVTSIRWPSQNALGDIHGQAYYAHSVSDGRVEVAPSILFSYDTPCLFPSTTSCGPCNSCSSAASTSRSLTR